MHIASLLARAARLHPTNAAIAGGGRDQSYAAFQARASRLAAHLCSRGLVPGERVSVLSWNVPEFLECYFAGAAAGLVVNPLNVRLSALEQVEVVRDCGARHLVAQASFAPLVAEILALGAPLEGVTWIGGAPAVSVPSTEYERALAEAPAAFPPCEPAGDAPAHLYYTSGTTGRAKGVILTHRNVVTHALGAIAELGLSERDTWAHVAPLFHLADAWATFAITWAGGRHVWLERFEARAALDLLERERVTITNLIPTMLNLMVADETAAGRDWSALRALLSGGAPIAPEVVRRIVATFRCEYVQTYGMTETSPYLTLSLLKEHLKQLPEAEQLRYRAKTGRPFATVELCVVGDDGREVAPDERTVGEIRVRGETVTPGYWKRPEETAAAFEDGWLKTGDLAVVDREGYVTIVDRKKDMIITGGEKVYSTEVEHALYAHPAVLEAAVFGTPDPVWGEQVEAAVVLRAGAAASAEELVEHCRAHLAHYKAPRAIRFLAELPRTGSGKIAKHGLRRKPSTPPAPGFC
ncbi:MAG: long-chain-fatty-acid--CoA ligase [Planctomycetes bacterium]|nr:long-chain-fatty-acid--CoA ligase [Planctomycetota bacterium]